MSPSAAVEAMARDSAPVREALRLARELHGDDHRPVGDEIPFLAHLEAVAELLIERGLGEQAVAAGLLHDALEYTDVGYEELERRVGAEVAATVVAISEDTSIADPRERREEVRARVAAAGFEAQRVFAAEKIANVLALRDCSKEWDPEVEAEMGMSVVAQVNLWEEDMGMLFDIEEGEPLFDGLSTALRSLGERRRRGTEPLCVVVARAGIGALLEVASQASRAEVRETLREAVGWQELHENRPETDELVELHEGAGEANELLTAFGALQGWLRRRFEGPVELAATEVQKAVHALAWGWGSTIVHALAGGPLTLEQLRLALSGLPDEALRRYLAQMEEAGLLRAEEQGAERRYEVTEWMRDAVAPLAMLSWYELMRPDSNIARPDDDDVHAAFSLVLPGLQLPAGLSGTCWLGVELGGDVATPRLGGVTAHIEDGRIVATAPGLADADAWATAPIAGWLTSLANPDAKSVEIAGDEILAGALLAALHERLDSDRGAG